MSERDPEFPERAEQASDSDKAGEASQDPGHSGGRRDFLKGVVTTSPLVLTVAGRPVWGNPCTLSGQMSGNLSAQDGKPCVGEGCTPGFWKNHLSLWHPQFPPGMAFSAAFGVDAFPGRTLYDVILSPDRAKHYGEVPSGCFIESEKEEKKFLGMLAILAYHAIAALQNSAGAVRYDLTVSEVQQSFAHAYRACSVERMEAAKNSLERLNEQYCPLP
jgi:hypothetical protein